MRYRTGRHNPHTLYAADTGTEPRGTGETPIGFIADDALAMLAAEAMTAHACPACPMACTSCSRNRATCECYEHQDAVAEVPVEVSRHALATLEALGEPTGRQRVTCRFNGSPHLLNDECQDVTPADRIDESTVNPLTLAGALETLRYQIGCWRSASLDGYDPGDLAEAAERLLAHHDSMGVESTVNPELIVEPASELVDEILKLAERLAVHRVSAATRAGLGDHIGARQQDERAEAVRLLIAIKIDEVAAAGVVEGRRQLDAEIKEQVFTSARQAAAEAGFAPGSDSVTVTYTVLDPRATALIEAYWKLIDHAAEKRAGDGVRAWSAMRDDPEESDARRAHGADQARRIEMRCRGIEDGARDLAELLGVDESEIERPEPSRG